MDVCVKMFFFTLEKMKFAIIYLATKLLFVRLWIGLKKPKVLMSLYVFYMYYIDKVKEI